MYTELSINWQHTHPQKHTNHKFEHFFLSLKISSSNSLESCIGLSFTVHLSVKMPDILIILKPKHGTNKLHSCNSNQIFFTKIDQQNGPFPHTASYTGTSHTKHLATFTQLAPLYYCYYYYFITIIILQLNYMNACHQLQDFLHLK